MFAKKNDNDSDAEEESSTTKSKPVKKTRAKKTTVQTANEGENDGVQSLPKVRKTRRTKLEIQADKLEKELMKEMEGEKVA